TREGRRQCSPRPGTTRAAGSTRGQGHAFRGLPTSGPPNVHSTSTSPDGTSGFPLSSDQTLLGSYFAYRKLPGQGPTPLRVGKNFDKPEVAEHTEEPVPAGRRPRRRGRDPRRAGGTGRRPES